MGFKFFEKNRIVIFCALLLCVCMVAIPEITVTGSRSAINLWLNSVVPALMPFFIVANFLKGTEITNYLLPKYYPVIMAIFSGYPMGAKIAGNYYRDGEVERNELLYILSYSMVTGPVFLIGVVGVGIYGSQSLGVIFAISHYTAAFLNRIFYIRYSGAGSKRGSRQFKVSIQKDYYDLLTDSILDSFKSLGIILAYMVLFMIGTDLLQFSGLLNLLPFPEGQSLIKGILEMTTGCNSLAQLETAMINKAVLTSFILSFGGFSVIGQTMSMLKNCPIAFSEVFKIKFMHGILSAILTFFLYGFML